MAKVAFCGALDYEGAYRDQLDINLAEISKEIKKAVLPEWLEKKIEGIADRTGCPVSEIKAWAKKKGPLKAMLAKDPSKQSVHQKECARHLSENLRDFEVLPGSGPNALFVTSAGVMKGAAVAALRKAGIAENVAKSIDFKATFNGRDVYFSHKHTKESGGAQDNQHKDLTLFMGQARHYVAENPRSREVFIALADGAYYDTPFAEYCNHFDYLNTYSINSNSGPRVIACKTEDLPEVLDMIA